MIAAQDFCTWSFLDLDAESWAVRVAAITKVQKLKANSCLWTKMKKNPISQATVVPAMEQAKLFTQKKSDRHHTGKPRMGSLQYNTRKIIKGRRSAGIREREREHVSVALE